MKISLSAWCDVLPDVLTPVPEGRLVVRSTWPCGVVVQYAGGEVALGFGTLHDYTFAEEAWFRLTGDQPDGGLASYWSPVPRLHKPTGRPLTVVNERPVMSAAERELVLARRELGKLTSEARAVIRQAAVRAEARERRLAALPPEVADERRAAAPEGVQTEPEGEVVPVRAAT